MGSMVECMEAEHHDMVLAITSHIPHLIAYNIVGTVADLEADTKSEVIKFSASGFRDFTRIAASDPVMWRDIFLTNRDAVLEMLGRFSRIWRACSARSGPVTAPRSKRCSRAPGPFAARSSMRARKPRPPISAAPTTCRPRPKPRSCANTAAATMLDRVPQGKSLRWSDLSGQGHESYARVAARAGANRSGGAI